jgi:acyl dehydratase
MIRLKAMEGLKLGDSFSTTRKFSEKDVILFGDISRDFNPVHFDDRFAKVKHYRGRICHGLLVAGMITEIGGQMGWLATGMDFRFLKPVYFGDTIHCRFTISDLGPNGAAKGEAVYTNQDGATVLKAFITGIIPGPREKEVLKAMVEEGDPTNKGFHHEYVQNDSRS